MKRAALLAGLTSVLGLVTEGQRGCPCQDLHLEGQEASHAALIDTNSHSRVSKLEVQQEHPGSGGMSLDEVWQRYRAEEGRVAVASPTSLSCLDDRLTTSSWGTPGGELGEFTVALAAYLQEKDGHSPSEEVVESLFSSYLETVPESRVLTLCTDQQALQHVASELETGHVDPEVPGEHLIRLGQLDSLSRAASQGDRHFKLLLEHPEEYHLPATLPSMVLRAFYRKLWSQDRDRSKLKVQILSGEADPQAFLEVSCRKCDGLAGLVPHDGPALVSQLGASQERREELARFFARVSRSTPQKVALKSLRERIEQLALLGLDRTGSRIAAGLPFYTLSYSP